MCPQERHACAVLFGPAISTPGARETRRYMLPSLNVNSAPIGNATEAATIDAICSSVGCWICVVT